MSRRIALALGAATLLIVSACGGTPAASVSPPSAAPASVAPASVEAASQEPAASASAATGDAPCDQTTDVGTVSAAMQGTAFEPASLSVDIGDVIAWTNGDSSTHTATVRSDPTCTTPNLRGGETGAIVFNVAGTYEFFCKIHSSMTGTIEVTG